MIDTQSIRNKILDLAMRGQLAEQHMDDGSAEELYQQIQAEKQELISAGTIKREKALPEISAEEVPFHIPESWKWVHLGELFQHNTGKALNASDTQGQILEYITTSNLYWDRFELDDLKTMPFTESEIDKCTIKKGDLLVCEGGDIGRSAIWPFDYDMRIQNHIHRLRRYTKDIYTKFYFYLLWLYKQTGRINGIGIGLQGFSSKRVHSLIVPLAPYNESVRIVEIIDRAFSILDTIDDLQAQYADNQAVLMGKLIDAGIQGKLTEQLPEDGTAEDLYQQIQIEEQELIRAGRFKKKKPMPDIAEEDKTFEIPRNWKWVHLGDLISIESGIGLTAAEMIAGEVPVYGGNGITGYHNKSFVPEGTVVIGRVGYYCGSIHVTEMDSWVTDNAFITTYPENSIDRSFLVQVLRQMKLGQNNNGSAQPVVSGKKIYPLAFPLPPLAEQRRIAARLEEVLPICEGRK